MSAEREALIEQAEDHAAMLRRWVGAYPTDVFPVPPEDKRAKDGAAADVMREMACPQFAKDADMIERLVVALLAAPAPAEPREGEVLLDGKRWRLAYLYDDGCNGEKWGKQRSTGTDGSIAYRLVPTDAPEEE